MQTLHLHLHRFRQVRIVTNASVTRIPMLMTSMTMMMIRCMCSKWMRRRSDREGEQERGVKMAMEWMSIRNVLKRRRRVWIHMQVWSQRWIARRKTQFLPRSGNRKWKERKTFLSVVKLKALRRKMIPARNVKLPRQPRMKALRTVWTLKERVPMANVTLAPIVENDSTDQAV